MASSRLGTPYAKYVYPEGHALIVGNALLTSGTLSATLVTMTGPNLPVPASQWDQQMNTTPSFADIYGVTISSSDTASETVTISDGVTSIEYVVTAPSPVCDCLHVPYRFGLGVTLSSNQWTLTATAGAVSSGKTISVLIRGVASWT